MGVQVTRLCLWMSKFLTGLGQQLNCHPTRWLRKRLTLNLNARMRVVVVEMRAPKEAEENCRRGHLHSLTFQDLRTG